MKSTLQGKLLVLVTRFSLLILCCSFTVVNGQLLTNPTVDGPGGASTPPFNWTTCSGSPDSQIINGTGNGIFGINTPPAHGTTYCGFVSTANYEESIGQAVTINAGTFY